LQGTQQLKMISIRDDPLGFMILLHIAHCRWRIPVDKVKTIYLYHLHA